MIAAETGAERCFDTPAKALAVASDGRVRLEPGARLGSKAVERAVRASNQSANQSRDLENERGTEMSASGDVIGAVVYDEARYSGSSYTITVGHPCTKDGWMEWELELPEDWRNRVTSTQSWADCWVWLWDEAGTKEGPYKEDNPDIGAFSDRAWRVGMS